MLTPISLSMALAVQVLLGGSTGADGAFAPTVTTVLNVPDGGRFNYTTINIPAGVIIYFNRNQRNDPVSFLATGNVVIAGTLHVNGEAAPTNRGGGSGAGGYDGGDPGFGAAAGHGHGPGGGVYSAIDGYQRSAGAHSTVAAGAGAKSYGSKLCMPLVGGSGGAGNTQSIGGGGGGGALLVASETSISVSGYVQARGGTYSSDNAGWSGTGSGGCLRLVAPKVTVTGSLDAGFAGNYGAVGYVRIDAIDKVGIAGSRTPSEAPGFSIGSNMVVNLPTMPEVALISAAGIPTNGQPFFHTLLPGSPATQPVEFSTSNFTQCAKITLRVVPASGPAVETILDGLSNGVHTTSVIIPANTATAVEVYGLAAACPTQ